MSDFASTSQLAPLEEQLDRRRKRTAPALLVLMSMPALLLLVGWVLYLIDTTRPAIVDFRVLTQFNSEREVIVDGTMNKVRDCELVEMVARTTQREVVSIDFLDLGRKPAYSRPLGPQKFGPWSITAKMDEGVTLYARHRCNPFWTMSSELGSFVVGRP